MAMHEIIVNRMRTVVSRGPGRLLALGLGALALGVVIVASMQINTTHAASQMAAGVGVMETHPVVMETRYVVEDFHTDARNPGLWSVASDAMTASWPAIPESPGIAGSGDGEVAKPSREVYVWSTFLTAGVATDGDTTYTGYMPGTGQGTQGNLAHTSFTYADTDYSVLTLFHQQVNRGPKQENGGPQQTNSGPQQVVLNVDKRLPQHLALYVGNHEFKISESLVMGVNHDMYVWGVDSSPGWSEGQRLLVVMLEEWGGEDGIGTAGE